MIRSFLLLLPLFCSLFLLPGHISASPLVEKVAQELQPVSGVLVMPMGDEFLVDLDAQKGIREGDIFAVIQKGARIIHPETKAVIGTLDEVKGILQISRVKQGYSYARILAGMGALEKGDRIQRFEGIPARFWDYTGRGEGLYAELRGALPGLEWGSYATDQAQRPEPLRAPKGQPGMLIFILKDNGLGVMDGGLNTLRFYADALPAPSVAKTPSPVVSSPSASVLPPAVAATPQPDVQRKPGSPVQSAAPAMASGTAIVRSGSRQEEGIWYGPEIKGEPAGLAVGDFDGDGQQEIAQAFQDRLEISRLKGTEVVALGRVAFKGQIKALGLDAADLNGDGKPELYVTAVDGKILSSLVVEYLNGQYQQTLSRIPWYFHGLTLPGEGPTLVGQVMGRGKEDFSGPVFRIQRVGQELQKGSELVLPSLVSVYGFLPLAGQNQGEVFVNLSMNDELQVLTRDGQKLWQSEDHFGGREAFIERDDPDVVRDQVTRYVYLKARLRLSPAGEVLVPVNEGTRVVTRFREFKNSKLKAMVWDGYSLRETWAARAQNGYLADFLVADVDNDGKSELVMAILFSHGGLMSSSRSALVVYELE